MNIDYKKNELVVVITHHTDDLYFNDVSYSHYLKELKLSIKTKSKYPTYDEYMIQYGENLVLILNSLKSKGFQYVFDKELNLVQTIDEYSTFVAPNIKRTFI